MPDRSRDAFGRLVVDPRQLDRAGRVDALRRVAGSLQASAALDQRWIGDALIAWLRTGRSLLDLLDVRPPRGSRTTPQEIIRQAEVDQLLARLVGIVGSNERASRVLRGAEKCPAEAVEIRARLVADKAPKSAAAIGRALARHTP